MKKEAKKEFGRAESGSSRKERLIMSGDLDYYLVLELKPGSPMAEVKSQYRKLAKRYHPDLNGNETVSQEKFRRVNAAYQFLSDPERKAAYDAQLSGVASGAAPVSPSVAKAATKPAPRRVSKTRTAYPPGYLPPTRNPFEALLEVKASPSVWFGGTALVVLLLLGIGYCWENGIGEREDHPGAVFAFSPSSSPGALESGKFSTVPPSEIPLAAPDVSSPASIPVAAPPSLALKGVSPKNVSSSRPYPQHLPETTAGQELVKPLLARYRAVVPRIDRLINQGYAVCDADGNDARTEPLKADLVQLNAVRGRVRPAIAHLSRQADAEELRREAGPILADLRQLEARPQPVQQDIEALASAATETAPAASLPNSQ